MEKIVITGGTGLIGNRLAKLLSENGHEIYILTRNKNAKSDYQTIYWNVEKQEIENVEILKEITVIIHLAGCGIADKKWTPKRKAEIIDSRVQTANFLYDTFKKFPNKVKTMISASGIGYYGSITSEHIFKENDLPSKDFLGTCCTLWEKAIHPFEKLGIRIVCVRTGVVLSEKGGALEKIIKPIKMGVGSALGNGKQYFPWIHIEDLCKMYLFLLDNQNLHSSFNAVVPEFITSDEFNKKAAKKLHKPYFFPNVPSFVLKLALGEMSDLVLKGSRISCEKIMDAGFEFEYPTTEKALEALF
ncbi:TIGR01777 family oxidoreductase [Aureivirga sp. CE67]|uniref:TIGR01777 family oxidoreductase n=1 Tax=Aureivirga sp. CE67 TaxID=1788983 RepID=UPI0018CBEB06|nr:TIGR01777 family oxidoreductase [Aureivirga sp. CE67]